MNDNLNESDVRLGDLAVGVLMLACIALVALAPLWMGGPKT